MNLQQINKLPNFFYLLNENDQKEYISLRDQKRDQHRKYETFIQEIDKLKQFVERGDGDDWKRSLVCGIRWIHEGVAINNQQLKIVLNKCKSSLNASLSKAGLGTTLGRGKAGYIILNTFPFLKNNSTEMRQWTVRLVTQDKISNPAMKIILKDTKTELSHKLKEDVKDENNLAQMTKNENEEQYEDVFDFPSNDFNIEDEYNMNDFSMDMNWMMDIL